MSLVGVIKELQDASKLTPDELITKCIKERLEDSVKSYYSDLILKFSQVENLYRSSRILLNL